LTNNPTNEDTSGPYFPINLVEPGLKNLTEFAPGTIAKPEGKAIVIKGSVRDKNNSLAHGVLMEFWQANTRGIYRSPFSQGHADIDPWFHGFGRLRSSDGNYSFKTILPGATPGRAPNITVTLFSDGFTRLVTQLFFAGSPENETDPLLQSLDKTTRERLVAQPASETDEGAFVYRFDIKLAGENETPFFDDFES